MGNADRPVTRGGGGLDHPPSRSGMSMERLDTGQTFSFGERPVTRQVRYRLDSSCVAFVKSSGYTC